jgi:deoxycytidylate deaminase
VKKKLKTLWTLFVQEVATLSTCERRNVGCVLLSMDLERLLAFGYNGTYRGGPNSPPVDFPGTDAWVHAEANALVKTRPVEPFVAVITLIPCYQCAMLLVNSGCQHVYAISDDYRDRRGWELLTDLGRATLVKEWADGR